MAKTTKIVRGIHSWIKFQRHQGIQSLTIEGKDTLADISQDKNGDANLVFNADKDKVNTVVSNVPYLPVAHTTSGTDPNQEKTATLNHDLTKFELGSDGLIDISKTPTTITLYTNKIIEKINEKVTSAVTTKEAEIKQFIGEVKEELTTKIDDRDTLSYYKEIEYEGDPCAYFHLKDSLISESILIFVFYNSNTAQQYISTKVIANYVDNNVKFKLATYNGVIIHLPEKVSHVHFEVVTLGHILEKDKINTKLALISDTSIEPYAPIS